MKRWNVDRVTVFLVIAFVSFLYDITLNLGIRDTLRFPHPFVYFRTIGDVAYLRGFPEMLRQVMFSLVAGGLMGWTLARIILSNDRLTRATIRFLKIVMWFPFLALFVIPAKFQLGVVAAMLAAVFHYLMARSFLEFSNREAGRYAAGEVTFQVLFFSLISQLWLRRWDWFVFPAESDSAMGITAYALILTLVVLINWIFGRTFLAGCTRLAILRNKELFFLKEGSLLDVTLLTIIWLLSWQLTSVALEDRTAGPFSAIQRVCELLITQKVWRDIFISLTEVGGGLCLGGLLALAVSTVMRRSENIQHAIVRILPATYLSPIVLWLLVFDILLPGVEYKMTGVGLLTFFPLVQTSWGSRNAPLPRRWLIIAIDDALPIAFVAMLFGELYASTAGLGFQMVVAGATGRYQDGLAWFLITAILLSAVSVILRRTSRLSGVQNVQIETS